jgi:hypothetical protein
MEMPARIAMICVIGTLSAAACTQAASPTVAAAPAMRNSLPANSCVMAPALPPFSPRD